MSIFFFFLFEREKKIVHEIIKPIAVSSLASFRMIGAFNGENEVV